MWWGGGGGVGGPILPTTHVPLHLLSSFVGREGVDAFSSNLHDGSRGEMIEVNVIRSVVTDCTKRHDESVENCAKRVLTRRLVQFVI